ncbi:MAG TPA: radical SAM family heme chaperone HemW [Nitrospirota bacterium]|jgi:oxygen-independent coproporphyrinogen-3 oxidase
MRAGVYLHIPFCLRKCHYCSFNSIPYDEKTAERYAGAIRAEIASSRIAFEAATLYIGGGTPTVLPQDTLLSIVRAARDKFKIKQGIEATIEANPGTVGGLDIPAIVEAGINRVSLGVQSFNPAEQKLMGRAHGVQEVESSFARLREGGIDNISLDLIYSLPGQDIASWRASLGRAADLKPSHISLYDLSIDEGTVFYSEFKAGRIMPPPEEVQVDMYLQAVEFLESEGYIRYEISNFALPGRECQHNLDYWSAGDFIGFGAGAHSYAGGAHWADISNINDYIDAVYGGGQPSDTREELSSAEREREYLMLGLRKAGGFRVDEYAARFGRDFMAAHGRTFERLARTGYMEFSGGNARLTLAGILASNRVMAEFF